MEFYTSAPMKRPQRLCEDTRRFAWESLDHKYGLDTRKTPAVTLDHIENFNMMSNLEKYDTAIREIVEKAPIRICDGEKISGAATLGNAIDHVIPVTYKEEQVFYSVSHLTLDFPMVLKYGFRHIREKVLSSLETYRGTDREPFLNSCISCLDSFEIWHGRYLEALKEMQGYEDNYRNLLRVPMEAASNFYEAVQSIWFTFAFMRLGGNWPGIGRIDVMLGPYLKKDLAEGVITLEEAREILAHLFIKGCEWICGGVYYSGDAQHYQNLVLAGVDEEGQEVTNEVTYLVLDILEELGISDFPTTVRVNENTDEQLLKRVAEVIRYGGGILAVYNEDLILEALTGYGYPLKEARQFANDGCWEVQIPGKTEFMYTAIDSLHILQHDTLKNYQGTVDYRDFEALYGRYVVDLKNEVERHFRENWMRRFAYDREIDGRWIWKATEPCTLVSLLEEGCIENGLSYYEGGPVYKVESPHLGGLADTVNSLYAIKKLVFEEQKLSLQEFIEILGKNWEGEEVLRQYVLNTYKYYGNDNDEVDSIAVRLVDDFAEICSQMDGRCGYNFPAGISTFGRQLEWLPQRIASPHGRKKGEVLAGNTSPTPGTDKEGATAIIKSYCKNNLRKMVTGAALDLKLLPSSVKGEDGLEAMIALIRGFVILGGCFMQLDVVETEVLRDAQKHPDDYQNLSVRVSGWNARFVTLNSEWQNMIIEQTEK